MASAGEELGGTDGGGGDSGGGGGAGAGNQAGAGAAPANEPRTVAAVAGSVAVMPLKGVLFAGRMLVKGVRMTAAGVAGGGQALMRLGGGAGGEGGGAGGLLDTAEIGRGSHDPTLLTRGEGGVEDMLDEDLMGEEMVGAEDLDGDAMSETETAGPETEGDNPMSDSGNGSLLGGSTVPDGGQDPCDGPGTYYYFKASLAGQTFQTRMRWLPLVNLVAAPLPHTHFTFTCLRPMPEMMLSLTLYVTPSNKRKGRVAARLHTKLATLMDNYAPGSVMSTDGAPDGVIQPFDDEEFGSAQLLVRAADADWRAALHKVPQQQSDLSRTMTSPVKRCQTAPPNPSMHESRRGTREATDTMNGNNGPPSSRRETQENNALLTSTLLNSSGGAIIPSSNHNTNNNALLMSQRQQEVSIHSFVEGDPIVSTLLNANAAIQSIINRAWLNMTCPMPQARPARSDNNPAHSDPSWNNLQPTKSVRHTTLYWGAVRLYSAISQRLQSSNTKGLQSLSSDSNHIDLTTISNGGPASGIVSRVNAVRGALHLGGHSHGHGSTGGAGDGGAAATQERAPIGEVRLRLHTLRAPTGSGGAAGVYAVLKCGPHWARTAEELSPHTASMLGGGGGGGGGSSSNNSGGVMVNWEVRMPLYDPATLLTVAVVEQQTTVAALVGKAPDHQLVGKARMRLSTLDPFTNPPGWRTFNVYAMQESSTGGDTPGAGSGGQSNPQGQQQQQHQQGAVAGAGAQGTNGHGGGNQGGAGANGAAGQDSSVGHGARGADGTGELLCVLQVQVRFPQMWLPKWQGALKMLDMYSYSALPEPFYYLEIDDSDTWKGLQNEAISLTGKWLAGVQPPIPLTVSTAMTDDNRNTFALSRAQLNFARAQTAIRALMRVRTWFNRICTWSDMQDSGEVLFCIILLCYYPSTAFKLFFAMLAMTSYTHYMRKYGPNACAVMRAAAEAKLQRMNDVEADVPTNTHTLQMLRQRYERLLEIALSAQNLFDDVASFLERLQAIMTWQDRAASLCFLLTCLVVMLALQLMGLSTLLCLVLMWQVRPPMMRDPIPPKPISYFMRLPCRSDELI